MSNRVNVPVMYLKVGTKVFFHQEPSYSSTTPKVFEGFDKNGSPIFSGQVISVNSVWVEDNK